VAAVVPAVDEVLDGRDEVFDRGEAAAADGLAGDDREEDLYRQMFNPQLYLGPTASCMPTRVR
jgi:hypothetical protein